MPSDNQVVTTVLAVVNEALPPAVRAYTPSKVPTTLPAEFVVVTVARRSGGSPRAGRYATRGWAVYFMASSATSDTNAGNALRLIDEAIENRPLLVADETSTPVRFDNARPVAPDDNWFSGVNTYTFAI